MAPCLPRPVFSPAPLLRRGALATLLLYAPEAAQASLIGDTVGAAFGGSAGGFASASAVVGPGVEFSFFVGALLIDIDALGFTLISTSSFDGLFSTDPRRTVTLSLTSLDTTTAIVGVTLVGALGGVRTSVRSGTVNLTWNEQPFVPGVLLDGTLRLAAAPAAVPAPPALALFGAALLGLRAARGRATAARG